LVAITYIVITEHISQCVCVSFFFIRFSRQFIQFLLPHTIFKTQISYQIYFVCFDQVLRKNVHLFYRSWCCHSKPWHVHSALQHWPVDERICIQYPVVSTYFSGIHDTLPIEANANLYHLIDYSCWPLMPLYGCVLEIGFFVFSFVLHVRCECKGFVWLDRGVCVFICILSRTRK